MNELVSKVEFAFQSLPPFKKIVVGLSGGVDSIVLTHVLKNLGHEVIVAHLNHQLRETANRDEAFVLEVCKNWGLPCVTKKAVIPTAQNLENNGRKLRYEFLEGVRGEHEADLIAVGHHFDDQIETILMHEKRGAGLRGKRGMRFLAGKILRPLLNISRLEIEDYAKQHALSFVTDESNMDLSFERNRLRQEVIPELKKIDGFEEKIRQISAEATFKLSLLEAQKEEWIEKHNQKNSFERKAFNPLDHELKVEILIGLLGQEDLYQATLNRLINFVLNGETGKQFTVKGLTFFSDYERLSWQKVSSEPLTSTSLRQGETTWGKYQIHLSEVSSLHVRSWKKGDRFQPSGMTGTKKLQDFFTDIKIPQRERSQIPVIVDAKEEIVCVGDLRFSEFGKGLKGKIEIKKIL